MKTTRIFILLAILVPASLWSQTPAEVFSKMAEAYRKADQLKVEVQVNVKENGKLLPFGTRKTSLKKSGDNFLVSFSGLSVLTSAGKQVLVSEELKLIQVKEVPKRRNVMDGNSLPDETTFTSSGACIEGRDKYGLHVVISDPAGLIRRTDLWLDEETFFLNRVQYFYNKEVAETDQEVEIIYSYSNLEKGEIAQSFRIENFVKRENGKWVAAPPFAGYTIDEPKDISLSEIDQMIKENW